MTGTLCALGKADMSLSDDEVQMLRCMVEVLTPFNLATSEMSAEQTPSLSKMLPTIRQIMEVLEREKASPLRDHLQAEMIKRFYQLENNVTLCMATYLDPRFKKLSFRN